MHQTGKAKMIVYPCNVNLLLYQGTDHSRDDDSPQKVYLLRPSESSVSFDVSWFNSQSAL
jgi:hypothetical protein